MAKGRKAIPNEIKALRGTDQPCRMKDEVSVDRIQYFFEKIPKNSPLKTKRAKKIFIEKANQLVASKILTAMDLEQLSMYAYSVDVVYQAMEAIGEMGHFQEIHDENGYLLRYVENPYLKLFRDHVKIANEIGANFGFSPVSRQKIQISKEEDLNPFEKLFSGI